MFFFARAARASARSALVASTLHRNPRLVGKRLCYGAVAAAAAFCATSIFPSIHLDSLCIVQEEIRVDPATSISFPMTIRIPSKTPIPPMTLLGLGVRTVSFLGIKVYSVAFYADLNNPNLTIPLDLSPDDKIRYIVENTSCILRIVPVRTTSYTHLRDAFMRALQARLAVAKKSGFFSEGDAQAVANPLRRLKSLFPNSPFEKNSPLDIYLAAPALGKPRALILRDLGGIENDWVATELVLHYFEGPGPSPLLKKSVIGYLQSIKRP